MNSYEKSRRLRELIQAEDTLVMPDAFDPVSARIIECLGFKAVQCSGFSMAVAAVRPTEAELGMEANLNVSRAIRDTEDFVDILDKNQVCGMEDIAALLKGV